MVKKIIGQVDTTSRWGLYDREPLSHWGNGRFTLLGDAAHPMLPHMGRGANQSIEDAVALAAVLDGLGPGDFPDAVRRYEAVRRARATQVQRNSQRWPGVRQWRRSRSRRELRGTVADLPWSLDYDAEAEVQADLGELENSR